MVALQARNPTTGVRGCWLQHGVVSLALLGRGRTCLTALDRDRRSCRATVSGSRRLAGVSLRRAWLRQAENTLQDRQKFLQSREGGHWRQPRKQDFRLSPNSQDGGHDRD
jgi:hypothetical protein